MCGIVGYVGKQNAVPLLLNGLKRLEYRGYDSAGIATLSGGKINVIKTEGRIDKLALEASELSGTLGIGHTRWATHGAPKQKNAHPHVSKSGTFAIVHNGIIENYKELKEFLIYRNFTFSSDTDSEVIAQLMEYYYTGDVISALIKTATRLKGSYAVAVVCANDDKLYVMKKDNPLVVGICSDCAFVASDMQALIDKTRDFYVLENGEIAVLGSGIKILNLNGEPLTKQPYHAQWQKEEADKGSYAHFMLKEIFEQPKALYDTLNARKNDTFDFLNGINNIHIIGCGSAYHAALMGKYVIESLTGIKVDADIASEFRYRNPIITENDLLLAISQSGETADTIGALKIGENKCKLACIVNVPECSLSRLGSAVYTKAGPEVAVATTKGFTTQLLNLYLIAENLLARQGDKRRFTLRKELEALPDLVTQTLKIQPIAQRLGTRLSTHDYAFFYRQRRRLRRRKRKRS